MEKQNMSREAVMLEKASRDFADRLSNYPVEEQICVGLIGSNVLNGCSWAFTGKNPDLIRNTERFHESKTCSISKVAQGNKREEGYLVMMSMDRLISILNKEAQGLIDSRDLQRASENRQKAIIEFDKLLKKGRNGKPYRGKIGIYCVNDTHSITVKGDVYPAYAITFQEMITICNRNNYGFNLGGIRRASEVAKVAGKVIEKLEVAPSKNALLIEICPLR